MTLKISRRLAISSIVIIYTWLGLVRNNVSMFLGGVLFECLSFAVMLLAFRLKNKNHPKLVSEESIFSLLVLFSTVYFICSFLYKSGDTAVVFGITIPVFAYNTIFNLPIWIANMVVYLRTDVTEKRALFKLFNIILLYNILITVIALHNDISFAKDSAAGHLYEGSYSYAYWGAMGYELVYSVILLIPLYLYIGFEKKQKMCLVIAGIAIYYVFLSSFFIAVIALVMISVLSISFFIKRKAIRYSVIFLLIIILLFVFLNYKAIGRLLISISYSIDSYELSQRFLQLGRLILLGDSSGVTLSRIGLYQKSLRGILKHPLFGTLLFDPYYSISGHSTLLDIWAGFGVLVFILFVSILHLMAKHLFYNTKKVQLNYMMLSTIITFVFVATANPILSAPHIMLIVVFVLPLIESIFGRTTQEV